MSHLLAYFIHNSVIHLLRSKLLRPKFLVNKIVAIMTENLLRSKNTLPCVNKIVYYCEKHSRNSINMSISDRLMVIACLSIIFQITNACACLVQIIDFFTINLSIKSIF